MLEQGLILSKPPVSELAQATLRQALLAAPACGQAPEMHPA